MKMTLDIAALKNKLMDFEKMECVNFYKSTKI